MQKSLMTRIIVWFGVAFLLLWSLLPIYWTIVSSMTPSTDFTVHPIRFFPEHPTSEHYLRLFGLVTAKLGGVGVSEQFRAALFNSIITSSLATIICVVMSLLGAYAFTRLEFPGRNIIFYAVVATIAIPGYAVIIPLFRIMVALHQIDSYFGVTMIYVSAFLPLCLWLLKGVFDTLPISLEEAARLDGAGHMKILTAIIVPIAAPGIAAAAILTFLGAWGLYAVPLIFSPKITKPLTVMIPEFAGKNFIDYGLIMSSGTVAIAVPCLLVIFMNRYLVAGLLAGSGK